MHYQRTLGMLDTIASAYGASFPLSRDELAKTEAPVTVETDRVRVTVCPGYVNIDAFFDAARQAFEAGEYDAVLSVLPPQEMVAVIGKTPLGVVDSYNTRNLQLFTNNKLHYLVGKYSSSVGPAFALMFNAVTGYASDFRNDGKAIKVAQNFWTSDNAEDFNAKYTLSQSETKNAYSFEDLSAVCKAFNPEADLVHLIALAQAGSYEAVLVRRGEQ